MIKIYFSIKEIDFIGQYDLATNRLSQISLDFGEVRKPIIVQRLDFDLNELLVQHLRKLQLTQKCFHQNLLENFYKEILII